MRFKAYIAERITKAQQLMIDNSAEYFKIIDQQCIDIVSIYKSTSKFFYRGINEKAEFIEKEGRKGVRVPRNTDKKTHIRLNALMKEKFGWKVRDGVSVTSNIRQTILYGESYIFLPINKYKFVYSPTTYDLFSNIKIQPIGMNNKEWEVKEIRSLKRLVNKHQDTNLIGAFDRVGEVMFKTSKYYLLNTNFESLFRKHIGI